MVLREKDVADNLIFLVFNRAKKMASGSMAFTNICETDSSGTTCTADDAMFDIFPQVS